MPEFNTVRGRLVDLRRYVNAHHPIEEGSDRYEGWIKPFEDDNEVQFVIHSRAMPARRGHRVCLIHSPELRAKPYTALVNLDTGEAVNYLRTDPPWLLCRRDVYLLLLVGVILYVGWKGLGVLLWVPTVPLYLIAIYLVRKIILWTWMGNINYQIRLEQVRAGWRRAGT